MAGVTIFKLPSAFSASGHTHAQLHDKYTDAEAVSALETEATVSITGEWTFSDKMFIDGSGAADVQLTVQGATSQSAQIFVVEQSDGTNILTVEAGGDVGILGNLLVRGTTGIQLETGGVILSDVSGSFNVNRSLILGLSPAFISDNGGARFRMNQAGTMLLFDHNQATRVTISSSSPHVLINDDLSVAGTLGVTGACDFDDELDVAGHSAFGASGIVATSTIVLLSEALSATSGLSKGFDVTVTRNPSSGSSLSTTGLVGIAKWSGSGTATGGTLKGLDFRADHLSSRSLTLAIGCEASIFSSGAGILGTSICFNADSILISGGAVPLTAVGLRIENQGNASETNCYGLQILAQTAAGTLTVGIKQEGTTEHNRLAGDTTIGADATPVCTLDVNGGFAAATVAKTGAYTATSSDHVITCDASGGSLTVTLPAASGVSGIIYHIKKTDSSGNTVTVDGNSSETIDGDTTKIISTQYDSMMIISNGSNWHII